MMLTLLLLYTVRRVLPRLHSPYGILPPLSYRPLLRPQPLCKVAAVRLSARQSTTCMAPLNEGAVVSQPIHHVQAHDSL